jgi:predicted RNA-binding protein with PIN domain
MIILIDGYNLLKQIFPLKKHILDAQKNLFIQKLGAYKNHKNAQIHEIIVVFDGGASTHATRTVKYGIVILYSGIKSSADDWIIDFTTHNKTKELLVVTLDRKLRDIVQNNNADCMSVYDFYTLMTNVIALSGGVTEPIKPADLVIYTNSEVDKNDNPYKNGLDDLMIEASLLVENKPDQNSTNNRSSRGKTLSKIEKEFIKKIKKLG